MEKNKDINPHKPHDTYFEQVFKILPVATQLLRKFLRPDQLSDIDLDTLQLVSESFVSEELHTSFSDLIYTCESADKGSSVRICLLFEHKSGSTGRYIYGQLGRYLIGIQEEDIKQHREFFTLTIPILFYHGKEPWKIMPLREQYGKVQASLQGFVPHFDIIVINLREMSDDQIMAMHDAQLLRNIFLAFKHAWDEDFFRHNFAKVFIFAEGNISEEVLQALFYYTYLYVQLVTTIKKNEFMELIQTMPPQQERRAKTVYEQIIQEGMEKVIVSFLLKYPTWSDQEIAEAFSINLELVQKIRHAMGKVNT